MSQRTTSGRCSRALAIPEPGRELPGVTVRPFAGSASRRIGLICRTTYAHLGELELLAEIVVRHLPAAVQRLAESDNQ